MSKTAEMKNLLPGRVFQHGGEVGCLCLALGDPDYVGGAVARRKLHEAEPVAARNKAERFGIDGNRPLVAGGVFN